MKQGENITIQAKVLRVEGHRLDAQTPNGELIQTDVSNVTGYKNKAVKPESNKAVPNAPETKVLNK